MKTLFMTKKGLALLAFTLLSAVAYAQPSSIDIINSTDCYYLVEVRPSDPNNCGGACTTGQICIPPNSVVSLPPCAGGPNLEWAGAAITPTDSRCNPCQVPGIGIARVCYPMPVTDRGAHCDKKCSTYTAAFTSPTTIEIY